MDRHPKMRARLGFREAEEGSAIDEEEPKCAETEENCVFMANSSVEAQRVCDRTEVNSLTTHRQDQPPHEDCNSVNRSMTRDVGNVIEQENADMVICPLHRSVQDSLEMRDHALSSLNISHVFSHKDTHQSFKYQSFNCNLSSEAPFPETNYQPISVAPFPTETHQLIGVPPFQMVNNQRIGHSFFPMVNHQSIIVSPFPMQYHQPISEAPFPIVNQQPINEAPVNNREPINEASVQDYIQGLNFTQAASGAKASRCIEGGIFALYQNLKKKKRHSLPLHF